MRKIETPLPYLCQWDNEKHPGGSCNLTSLAMVMLKYGIKGPNYGYKRLPDNLMAYAEAHNLDRHVLTDIDKISEAFGLADKSSYTTSFADIKKHVLEGKIVIVHGNFTPSGHIMCIRGFDEEKSLWKCNDPAGLWKNGGYAGGSYGSGDGVWYGSEAFRRAVAPDGVVWAHLMH